MRIDPRQTADVSHDPKIVIWSAAVYCAMVARNPLLVGGTKRKLRNDAPGAANSELANPSAAVSRVWENDDQYCKNDA
jgi:hypothetical protein